MESNPRLERQTKRRRQILGATLRLLRRHGTGISTAQIAAEANCSKETLYNWFEDRDGIFKALAEEQAAAMGEALARSFADNKSGFRERLVAYCVALMDIMTGEAVIAVNRTAMAQACADNTQLGTVVLDAWQEQVTAPFLELFDEGIAAGEIRIDDQLEAFEMLMGLLVGDTQRRLLLGDPVRPDAENMENIAKRAVERWLYLHKQ